ncbi:hypothetical protein, partial [Staphylococcus aureus]
IEGTEALSKPPKMYYHGLKNTTIQSIFLNLVAALGINMLEVVKGSPMKKGIKKITIRFKFK